MPTAKYIVELSEEERERLRQLVRRGTAPVRLVTRARVLLKADEGLSDEQVAEALDVGYATVGRTRQRFVQEGMEPALRDRSWPGRQRKLNGNQEAHLIAVACSTAPEGHARWTLRLLAGKVVELGYAPAISHETVRQLLKKTT